LSYGALILLIAVRKTVRKWMRFSYPSVYVRLYRPHPATKRRAL